MTKAHESERMSPAEFQSIRRGQGIVVSVGSTGPQYALAHHWTRHGALYVMKWQRRGATWTQARRIGHAEVIRCAIIPDVMSRAIIPPEQWRMPSGGFETFRDASEYACAK